MAPVTCTPKHLAEKILTSKGAIEGERKMVTVTALAFDATLRVGLGDVLAPAEMRERMGFTHT